MLDDYANIKILFNWDDMRKVAGPAATDPLKPGDIIGVTISHNKFLLEDYLFRNPVPNVKIIFIGDCYESRRKHVL